MNTFATTCAAVACAAVLSACQTTPQVNADLTAARAALSQAQANPYAPRAASVELERAQQALRRAEAAWADKRDTEETKHLAYVAQRRAETALAVAMQAQSEERVQQAGAERERVRLEARTREAEAAARSAQAAQATARTAQSSAQTAQGQAEQARQEAEAARQRLQQEQARAAALERDLKSLQGQSTQRGMVVTMGDVLFASGRATLQPGAQRNVQRLAQVLKQYPERRVMVEGFTDSQGSEEKNQELSQRRAEAFRQALLNAGVAADRIEVRGHGEGYPVASNDTPTGRQQNRRVEVLFSDAQGRFTERS